MNDTVSDDPESAHRRGFLKTAGAATAVLGAGLASDQASAAGKPSTGAYKTPSIAPEKPPTGYNILFILTDQERYFRNWPFPVPGRTALQRQGVTFTNHQIASCVCSPSRSTIYTGQHIQHTRVSDNCGMPWQADMSTDLRTIGDMMRDAGYHAAYLGKWHLGADMHQTRQPYDAPVKDYNETMREYGFDDYFGVGDLVGETRGGYNYDGVTTESAVSWMRSDAAKLSAKGKNWFLAVNLVNPHDVMFLDTDPPGTRDQARSRHLFPIAPAPVDSLYFAKWDSVELPRSRHQPFDQPGRPVAHGAFGEAWKGITGAFPFTDSRIRTYQDYYFNCIRDCDTHLVRILETLEALGLTEKTIVVMSSDHGELGGAHQLIGKGATAYSVQNHVPLIIRHPAYPGGKKCQSVTSHIDIAPTLLGLTGASSDDIRRLQGDQAKGHNFAGLLSDPDAADVNAVRKVSLFNYMMLSSYDSEWTSNEFRVMMSKGAARDDIVRRMESMQPDFSKRGAIRSVFDGRYRFSRYFALSDYNAPSSIEELFARNDVELYDTFSDPDETRNLAVDQKKHGDILMAMNLLMRDAIRDEVGDDTISALPFKDGKIQILNIAGRV